MPLAVPRTAGNGSAAAKGDDAPVTDAEAKAAAEVIKAHGAAMMALGDELCLPIEIVVATFRLNARRMRRIG
jgi:hypothetical protein